MFTALTFSDKEAFNPKLFCNAFKDFDGNPTNVYEQMDVDEFFNVFMEKIEE
jgi:ubiquitin carboxyl-terminal hydrolase 9/24